MEEMCDIKGFESQNTDIKLASKTSSNRQNHDSHGSVCFHNSCIHTHSCCVCRFIESLSPQNSSSMYS